METCLTPIESISPRTVDTTTSAETEVVSVIEAEVGFAPEFTEPLHEIAEVTEGDKLVVTCKVTANPKPTVLWYLNDEKLDQETDDVYKISVDSEGLCTLSISEVFPEDEGIYRCEAMNIHGRDATEVEVLVRALSASTSSESVEIMEPVIVEQPRPRTVEEGSSVQFKAVVLAAPKPTVSLSSHFL